MCIMSSRVKANISVLYGYVYKCTYICKFECSSLSESLDIIFMDKKDLNKYNRQT